MDRAVGAARCRVIAALGAVCRPGGTLVRGGGVKVAVAPEGHLVPAARSIPIGPVALGRGVSHARERNRGRGNSDQQFRARAFEHGIGKVLSQRGGKR